MSVFRIALASVRFPASPEESVTLTEQAIAQASIERADLICFPESFVPGYRGMGNAIPMLACCWKNPQFVSPAIW